MVCRGGNDECCLEREPNPPPRESTCDCHGELTTVESSNKASRIEHTLNAVYFSMPKTRICPSHEVPKFAHAQKEMGRLV